MSVRLTSVISMNLPYKYVKTCTTAQHLVEYILVQLCFGHWSKCFCSFFVSFYSFCTDESCIMYFLAISKFDLFLDVTQIHGRNKPCHLVKLPVVAKPLRAKRQCTRPEVVLGVPHRQPLPCVSSLRWFYSHGG